MKHQRRKIFIKTGIDCLRSERKENEKKIVGRLHCCASIKGDLAYGEPLKHSLSIHKSAVVYRRM